MPKLTDFDSQELEAEEALEFSSPAPAPLLYPHCDCMEANKAFGTVYNNNYERTTVSTMQRVSPTAGEKCPYCAHSVFFRTIERSNKNYTSKYGEKRGKRAPKPGLIAIWNREEKNRIHGFIKPKIVPKSILPTLPAGIKAGTK